MCSPRPTAPHRRTRSADIASDALGGTVDAHSAIVGVPNTRNPDEAVLVYYESNRIGATNIITFADRARRAYERLVDHAPTIARAYVPRDELRAIGTYHHREGRVAVNRGDHLAALCIWLDIAPGAPDAGDRLAHEMRTS